MLEINGLIFKKMLLSANNNLTNYCLFLNDINLFPVKDGDTGTNMKITFSKSYEQLEEELTKVKLNLELTNSCSFVAKIFSDNLLLNARGNSGFIFSQFFIGFSNYVKNFHILDKFIFSNAFLQGVDAAYNSVLEPVEGTMLTVMKESGITLIENINTFTSMIDFFDFLLKVLNNNLKNTTNILEVLKGTDLVDAGAFGFVKIFEGMLSAVKFNKIIKLKNQTSTSINVVPVYNDIEEIYGYCTEVSVLKEKPINIDNVKNHLKTMNNKSINVINGDKLINIHLHSLVPGDVLNYLQHIGSFLKVKVENMDDQIKNKLQNINNNLNSTSQINNLKTINITTCEILILCENKIIFDYFKKTLNIKNIVIFIDSFKFFKDLILQINTKEVIIIPTTFQSYISANDNYQKFMQKYTNFKIHLIKSFYLPEAIVSSCFYNKALSLAKNIITINKSLSKLNILLIQNQFSVKTNFTSQQKYFAILIKQNQIFIENTNLIELIIAALSKLLNNDVIILFICVNKKQFINEIAAISNFVTTNFLNIEINILNIDYQNELPFIFGIEYE